MNAINYKTKTFILSRRNLLQGRFKNSINVLSTDDKITSEVAVSELCGHTNVISLFFRASGFAFYGRMMYNKNEFTPMDDGNKDVQQLVICDFKKWNPPIVGENTFTCVW